MTQKDVIECKIISAHIDCLEEAYLISKANRYDIKGRRYITANLKYYFTDVGLRKLFWLTDHPSHGERNTLLKEQLEIEN